MVGALLKDWTVRLAVLIWLGGVVLYALYGPDAQVVLDHSAFYSTPLMLMPIVLAAWLGLSRVTEPHERRFWTVLGTGFAAWLAVSIPYAFISYDDWTYALDLTRELGYLLYYIFFILAIELRPHELHTGSLAEKERRLRTIGLTVFGLFVLWYFALVPASLSPETYATALPSFYMYVLLDAVIIGRLLWMRRETWSVRWSLLYAWLATAAAVVLAGDILEAAGYAFAGAAIDPGYWPDHLWTLPGVLFVIAIRARHVPFPVEQCVLNEPAPGTRALRAGHVLLAAAMVLPFLHYALYAANAFAGGTASRSMREVVSILSMMSLGGLRAGGLPRP